MNEMHGYMLHGVDHVTIAGHLTSDNPVIAVETDGRVFMWSNGAITVYKENHPWRIFPAHRVLTIVGREQG